MKKPSALPTVRLAPPPEAKPFAEAGVQADRFYLTRRDPADGKYIVQIGAGPFRSLYAADIELATNPAWAGCSTSKGSSVLNRPALYKLPVQEGENHGDTQ